MELQIRAPSNNCTYISLVWSHPEHTREVWHPHLVKNRKMLEDVQEFGCKVTAHQWDMPAIKSFSSFSPMSSEDFISSLGWCLRSYTDSVISQVLIPTIRDNVLSLSLSLTQIGSFFHSHKCIQYTPFSPTQCQHRTLWLISVSHHHHIPLLWGN